MAAERPSSLVAIDSSKTRRVLRISLVEEEVMMLEEEELEEEEDLERALMEAEAVSVLKDWLKLRAARFSLWKPLGTSLGWE